jgi:aryl-alcohol dehydrogenase-like predicted oxidoreductase
MTCHNSSGAPSPTPWHQQRRALTLTSSTLTMTTTTMTTKAALASPSFKRCNTFTHQRLSLQRRAMQRRLHRSLQRLRALMAMKGMTGSQCRIQFAKPAPLPVIFIVNTTSESLLKFSMSYFLTPLQYRMYKYITYMHHTCLIHASYIRYATSSTHGLNLGSEF